MKGTDRCLGIMEIVDLISAVNDLPRHQHRRRLGALAPRMAQTLIFLDDLLCRAWRDDQCGWATVRDLANVIDEALDGPPK
jgi:hypothetical protein